MSWFKELTSRAEAMLVKLDQDAAGALQNPDGFIANSKFFEKVAGFHVEEELDEAGQANKTDDIQSSNGFEHDSSDFSQTNITMVPSETPNCENTSQSTLASEVTQVDNIRLAEINPSTDSNATNRVHGQRDTQHDTYELNHTSIIRHPNKFTIHKSRAFTSEKKLVRRLADSSAASNNGKFSDQIDEKFNYKRKISVESLNANDIKASINRSLQSYTEQSYFTRNDSVPKSQQHHGESYEPLQSHFDNSPLIINSSPGVGSHLVPDQPIIPGRLRSSDSFSIDVPDDGSADSKPFDDITTRLLKQTVSKRKKSTFYLHQVINRLANPGRKSRSFISYQTRMKFRRSQLRAASYLRRLSYYFQAYPTMKYLLLGWLILMQLLVIYVLFFYQSISSPNDLSSQVKQQQNEITGHT